VISVFNSNETRFVWQHLIWAGFVQFLIVLATLPLPEMGDLTMYKLWANEIYDEGIYAAYTLPHIQFDQYPLYLYVSKFVGGVYQISGLYDLFGTWSRALSLLLKCAMVACHLATALLVYHLARVMGYGSETAQTCFMVFVWNPGILIATVLYGYQDAFHTLLLAGGLFCLFSYKMNWAWVFCALIFMTKPQAAVYLGPIGFYGIFRYGWSWGLRAIGVALVVWAIVLSPFWIYGDLWGVFNMYLGTANVHEWLTGYAHNFWWLFEPVPPFTSDRLPILWGWNGLQIGLVVFAGITTVVCFSLYKKTSAVSLVDACGLVGLTLFMVLTEIHENHHYAVFLFLALLARSKGFRWMYYILSLTFAVNLMAAKQWLETESILEIGFLRLDTINAMINGLAFLFWLYLFFVQQKEVNQQDNLVS
jgi:Gpi18-like mannosyltransferase